MDFERNALTFTTSSIKILSALACLLAVSAGTSANADDGENLPLRSIEIPLQIDATIIRTIDEYNLKNVATQICQNLGESLIAGQGPWGMGYLTQKPECSFVNTPKAQQGPNVWTLLVTKPSKEMLAFRVCRAETPTNKKSNNCLAEITRPVGKHTARTLAHPYYARAIIAALIDQMPIQAKPVPELIRKKPDGQNYFMPQKEPTLTTNIGIPDFTSRLNPVEFSVETRTGLFSVAELNRSKGVLDYQNSNIWLLDAKGRSRHAKALSKALDRIQKEIEKRVDNLEYQKAHPEDIVGRDSRGSIKRLLPLSQRIEGEFSIRGGYFNGIGQVQPEYSYGGSMDAALYVAPWLNLWVDGSYTSSVYAADAKIESSEGVNTGNSLKANFKNIRFGGGLGMRYTFAQDLTFFIYPRASKMDLSWKFSNAADIGTQDYYPEITTTFFPLFGVGAGFRSPETWPLNLQLTFGFDGFGEEKYQGISCDTEIMFELPEVVATLTSFGVFDRAWVSLFSRVQQHTFTVTANENDSKLNISEVIAGLGYRLEFL